MNVMPVVGCMIQPLAIPRAAFPLAQHLRIFQQTGFAPSVE